MQIFNTYKVLDTWWMCRHARRYMLKLNSNLRKQIVKHTSPSWAKLKQPSKATISKTIFWVGQSNCLSMTLLFQLSTINLLQPLFASCCLFLNLCVATGHFFVSLLFLWVTIAAVSPEWSHPIHTALNILFNADSKQFCERIIFILFNPPLHLSTFPSLQSCRSVPTIAPLPSSHSPYRQLCSLHGHVSRMSGRCLEKCKMPCQRGRKHV